MKRKNIEYTVNPIILNSLFIIDEAMDVIGDATRRLLDGDSNAFYVILEQTAFIVNERQAMVEATLGADTDGDGDRADA